MTQIVKEFWSKSDFVSLGRICPGLLLIDALFKLGDSYKGAQTSLVLLFTCFCLPFAGSV